MFPYCTPRWRWLTQIEISAIATLTFLLNSIRVKTEQTCLSSCQVHAVLRSYLFYLILLGNWGQEPLLYYFTWLELTQNFAEHFLVCCSVQTKQRYNIKKNLNVVLQCTINCVNFWLLWGEGEGRESTLTHLANNVSSVFHKNLTLHLILRLISGQLNQHMGIKKHSTRTFRSLRFIRTRFWMFAPTCASWWDTCVRCAVAVVEVDDAITVGCANDTTGWPWSWKFWGNNPCNCCNPLKKQTRYWTVEIKKLQHVLNLILN